MLSFSKLVAVVSALAAIAGAVPMNIPRDMSTVTEITYTTVDVSVQLVVDEDGNPLQTIVPSGAVAAATVTATSVAVASSAPTQSVQVVSSQNVAPVQSTTLVTMVPTTTTQPAAVAPSSSTTVAAAAPLSTSNANSGSSGTSANAGQILATSTNGCTGQSDACLGDITHYDGGQSACGPIVNSDTVMGIALPWEFMGTLSNTNPYCGRTLTILNPTTGVQVQASVVDKCMGCTGRSIDLTNAAFNAVAPTCNGRCTGFEWWFN